jgi:short-subunit dehydrogenase
MLRAELAREGIGVSVLCPGVVASNLLGTSSENRPDGFGAQAAPQVALLGGARDAGAPPPPVKVMPAEDVGPIAIRAIRANRFHVITHPETRRLVEGRFQAMLADFDFAASARTEASR